MSRSDAFAKAAAAAQDLAQALAEIAKEQAHPPWDPTGTTYDSQHLPPRTSRRRFAELCRRGRVPGAHREGRDWVCSREAWHASRCRRRPPPVVAVRSPSLTERADALLRRRGLRIFPKDGNGLADSV